MKSFLNKLILITLALGISSCSPTKKSEDFDDRNAQFFDVVYIAQASRVTGSSNWVKVQGDQRLKFFKSSGQEESDFAGGNYTVHFTNYKEPQLYNNGLCSGGFTGTFTLKETVDDVDSTETGPYNPMNNYDSGETQEADTTDTSRFVFIFTLSVSERSLSASCAPLNPSDPLSLRVIRFNNGDLIVTNAQRTLEFYMIPELVQ